MNPNPRYKCSADFPAKIPKILGGDGLRTAVGSWMANAKGPSPTKEFGYTISDDECSIDLTGGTIDAPFPGLEGATGFVLFVRPTWKFWRRKRIERLRERVIATLLRNGAMIWSDYQSLMDYALKNSRPVSK